MKFIVASLNLTLLILTFSAHSNANETKSPGSTATTQTDKEVQPGQTYWDGFICKRKQVSGPAKQIAMGDVMYKKALNADGTKGCNFEIGNLALIKKAYKPENDIGSACDLRKGDNEKTPVGSSCDAVHGYWFKRIKTAAGDLGWQDVSENGLIWLDEIKRQDKVNPATGILDGLTKTEAIKYCADKKMRLPTKEEAALSMNHGSRLIFTNPLLGKSPHRSSVVTRIPEWTSTSSTNGKSFAAGGPGDGVEVFMEIKDDSRMVNTRCVVDP